MTNIYSEIYSLIIGLFGGAGEVTFADGLCVIFSCFCVFFVVLIPFIIVFRIIRLISGG